MSTTSIKILIIFLFLALAVGYLLQNFKLQKTERKAQASSELPQSVFHRIHMTLLSADRTQYFLRAQQVSRHDDGLDEFVDPDLQFSQANTQWYIRSRTATARQKEFVQFDDDVSIVRLHHDGKREELKSQQLYLDLTSRHLSSQVKVTYRSNDIAVKANNMTMLLDDESLLLSGDVRGEYALP